MTKIYLRKIKSSDKKYFNRWWKDKELAKLTSGILRSISDKEVEKYFLAMLTNQQNDHHFVILVGEKIIGHIVLVKKTRDWYETRVVIGEKSYWNRGFGTQAIKLLLKKARRLGIIRKIYLEVRSTNIRAVKTYEKCGFVSAGVKKYPKNKYLPETLRMELKF